MYLYLQEKHPMHATFVVNHLLFNNPTTNICFTTLMTNPTPAPNVVGLSRNFPPYKTMKEFTVERGHLHVKLVAKVSDKESPTLSTGNYTTADYAYVNKSAA
jgi:hypothetical protein